MYVVFLAGGIASGKSTVARELERLGALRIDLDEVSRTVLEPGTDCVAQVAEAFGHDLIDPDTGELDRALLARRAFATAEDTALLESIELPFIKQRLVDVLANECCAATEPACCVVEVPLLDRALDLLDLADEVVVVSVPLEERRRRAVRRGMDVDDFNARVARQPTDEWLREHADTVLSNEGSADDLTRKVARWWDERAGRHWLPAEGR